MYIKVTERGIDNLHYLIGSMYELGMRATNRNLDINYTAAIKWYLDASNMGDSRVDYRLGMMHEEGKGVQKNLNTAINYYKKASITGNRDASYRLGRLYSSNDGATEDLILAFYYYTIASNLGHREATEKLVISADDEDILSNLSDFKGEDAQMEINEETKISMLE
jgi:TPR repeat protein